MRSQCRADLHFVMRAERLRPVGAHLAISGKSPTPSGSFLGSVFAASTDSRIVLSPPPSDLGIDPGAMHRPPPTGSFLVRLAQRSVQLEFPANGPLQALFVEIGLQVGGASSSAQSHPDSLFVFVFFGLIRFAPPTSDNTTLFSSIIASGLGWMPFSVGFAPSGLDRAIAWFVSCLPLRKN